MALSPINKMNYRTVPLTNTTPLTYRDGSTFQTLLNNISKYLNVDLPESLDKSLNEFGSSVDETLINQNNQILESVEAQNLVIAGTVETFQDIVDSINERTGPVPVQVVNLATQNALIVNPLWPHTYAVSYRITQSAAGGVTPTLPAGVTNPGDFEIRMGPLEQTIVTLYPVGESGWLIASDIDPVKRDEVVLKGEILIDLRDCGPLGTGDDSPTFLEAVRQINQRGPYATTTWLIPAGEYVVNSRIPLPSNTVIQGHGATIRKTTTAAGYTVFVSNSNGVKGYGSGTVNTVVQGLRFRGDYSAGIYINPFALHHADNIVVENCIFDELLERGHVFDLAGCSNILIRNNKFRGFVNIGGNYAQTECIQLDLSNAGSVSAPDLPGSYDGLPCINVTVDSNEFLPITVGETVYPAPNPFGNHAKVEGKIHRNIKFTNNVIQDALVGSTATMRGSLHFIGCEGIEILDNVWRFTAPNTTHVISLYSSATGVPEATANFEPGANNTVGDIIPLTCRRVTIRGNRFENFSNSAVAGPFRIEPLDGTGSLKDISITGNYYECVASGAATTNAVFMRYVIGFIMDRNIMVGPSRTIDGTNLEKVKIVNNDVVLARASQFRLVNSADILISGNTNHDGGGSMTFITDCTSVRIAENKMTGIADNAAIKLTGVKKFIVSGNDINAPEGKNGVDIYGASADGMVRDNIIYGGTTSHVNINASTTNVVESGNLKLAV